jgi:hypothetical protein
VRSIRFLPPAGMHRPPVRDDEPVAQPETDLEHGADHERARGAPASGEWGVASRSADLAVDVERQQILRRIARAACDLRLHASEARGDEVQTVTKASMKRTGLSLPTYSSSDSDRGSVWDRSGPEMCVLIRILTYLVPRRNPLRKRFHTVCLTFAYWLSRSSLTCLWLQCLGIVAALGTAPFSLLPAATHRAGHLEMNEHSALA